MKSALLPLTVLLLSLGLSSCDSVRSKITGLLDDAIGDEGSSEPSYKGATIRQITDLDYEEFTSVEGHLVVVDFYADWCPPCRKLSPVLNDLVAKHEGRVLLGKVDIDKNKQLAQKMKVRNIPDVRLFVDGKQVDRFVGMPPVSAIHERVERQLKKLKPRTEKPKPDAAVVDAAKPPMDERKPERAAAPLAPSPDGQNPEATQPVVQPMDKDWLPPGLERK